MKDPRKRKISMGTILMLTVTVLTLGGTVFVLNRLSSGAPVDLSRLQQEVLSLKEPSETLTETPVPIQMATELPAVFPTEAPVPETEVPEGAKAFTLTVVGTVSLDGEVRKNSYFSDVKQYDYYDTMMLLKKEIQSNLNIVFLENLISDEGNATDLTATGAGAAMLKSAGFNVAACGYSKSFDKAETGIEATRRLLKEHGIKPLGIYENTEEEHFLILDENGIRVALLQYTETIASGTRKNMTKKEMNDLVPAADRETVTSDIERAKESGAEVVLVLMNWGKTGKAPDKTMHTLAQTIADAGADMIIGNGSRIVSGAEMLTAAESGRQVLCVWSLGTVLSGDRSNIKRIAGMMLQAVITVENGQKVIGSFRYIPLYTWKYKQDGRYQYRCLAADGDFPDGMETEQQKLMEKAAAAVQSAMKDTPLEARISE